jgi:hypothetical protein
MDSNGGIHAIGIILYAKSIKTLLKQIGEGKHILWSQMGKIISKMRACLMDYNKTFVVLRTC